MRKIPFVIPVHNRIAYTRKCLEVLKEQQDARFFKNNRIDIIIVDDGSTDGTGDWLREHHPEVIVLEGDGNLWYTGGVNMGIQYALQELDPDFIMVWETDIFPVDDYFNHLEDILDNWDGNAVICSKMYYRSKPEMIIAMGGSFDPKSGKKDLIWQRELDRPEYETDLEVDWFPGHGVLIHKDIIQKVGYLDDVNFPQYHSDVDYGLRCKEAGYRNIVFHKLKLLHDTATTGLSHKKDKSFKEFIESLTSIRSNHNIRKDLAFYRKHTTSIWAYRSFIGKYLVYTGSFLKWMVLKWFGIQKKDEGLY